jgi:membrane-bound metal-dependent hydrolase YbcI (DUF457 family)
MIIRARSVSDGRVLPHSLTLEAPIARQLNKGMDPMANFAGHFGTGLVLGAAYGAAGFWFGHFDWGILGLAAVATTIGAMSPDLDSDSGVPIREFFGFAAAICPLFLIPRLRRSGLTLEESLCVMIGVYLFVRYGLSRVLKKLSVHRGMFHSLPALCIAGLAVFNVYHNDNLQIRLYMAGGIMLGFLSHLVLDELFAVDLTGIPRLKSSFGTAIKLTSQSWPATIFCYLLLFALCGIAYRENQDINFRTVISPKTRTQIK